MGKKRGVNCSGRRSRAPPAQEKPSNIGDVAIDLSGGGYSHWRLLHWRAINPAAPNAFGAKEQMDEN